MTDQHPIDALLIIASLPDPECDIYITIRTLLADLDTHPDELDAMLTDPIARALLPQIRDLTRAIHSLANTPYHSDDLQRLSNLLLDYSLCPRHHCDYAICFDDDDPDCAQIRAFFPSHDT